MKSKYAVIGMWFLLCFVPALVYYGFRDQMFPPSVTSTMHWPVEKTSAQYSVSLSPQKLPLKTGQQSLVLIINNLDAPNAKVAQPPVDVVMPMGKESMAATVTVHKMPLPNHFLVQAGFSMAGKWELQVRPDPTAEVMHLPFWVAL